MSNVGYATLTIIPSARGFASALGGQTGPAMARAGREGGGLFGSALMPSIGGLAAAAGGLFAAVGVGGFFKSAVQGAADLEQSVGAIETVFKGAAPQMLSWADTAATAVGLTKNEYAELGTLIGTQLKNGGTAMDELAPKTNELIGLGADLSSMFGGSAADAVGALSSALKGERDPIERYGVSLNQAKIDAEAAALGFAKVGGTLSTEANQAATLSLIMKQTADAHGNFARETDTLSHKQQVLNALWTDGKTRIGAALVPAVSALTGALISGLGPALDLAERGITRVTEVAGGVFKILGKGEFEPFAGLQEDSGIVDFLFDVRETAIGVTDILFKGDFSGPFLGLQEDSAFVDFLFNLRDAAIAFGTGFGSAISAAGAAFAPFLPAIGSAFASLLGPLLQVLPAISPLSIIFSGLAPVLPQIAALIGQLAVTIGTGLGTVLRAVAPLLVSLAGVLSGTIAAVIPVILPLIATLGTVFSTLVPVIAHVLAAVLPLVTTLVSQLAPIFIQLVSTVLPPVIAIIGMLVTAIAPVIMSIAGLLIPIIRALLPVVVTVFGVIASIISAAMTVVQGIIQVVTGIITGNWSQVWDGIKNVVSGVWELIKSVISGALAIVGSVIRAALAILASLWSTAWGGIASFLGGIWGRITGAISDAIGTVTGFFRDLPGQIIGHLGTLAGSLASVGRDMIQGLLGGVKEKAANIKDAVLGPIKDSVDAVKNFLGIHSPSRLLFGIGRFTGQGMANGLTATAGLVSKASDALIPTVPDVPPVPPTGYTPPSARPGGISGGGATPAPASGAPIVMNVHPSEGMSEEAFAQAAMASVNFSKKVDY